MSAAAEMNSHWFLKLLSYPRSIIVLLFIPIWTLFTALTIIILGFIPGGAQFGDFCASVWGTVLVKISGLEVEVRGRENLPQSGGLVLFNHTSNFDIFLMMCFLAERKLKFGAKAELFKVPFLARAMATVGALPIERKDREKVLALYKVAESRMQNGETFALAPEGTRQKDFNLGSFRNGPFLFAVGAQGPIIPLVIAGALPIMPPGAPKVNWGVWKRKVIMEILPVVETKNLSEESVKQVRDQVRSQMLGKYDELKSELGYPVQNDGSDKIQS
tara:strand:- start:129248 stop:130069 length:822 start_codon:yes stop_codon:yes gene_type:complete